MIRFVIIVAALMVTTTLCAQAGVQVEKIAYGGWPNCIRMSNGTVELIATTDVGPRIVRFGFIGQESLFYENPNEMGKVGGDEWRGYGGHRFWFAPERRPNSYHPDNTPVRYSIEGNTLKLLPGTESTTGIEKEIDITLDSNTSHVEVLHKLTNHNIWAVEVAPWALTVFKSNGQAIFPQEPYAPHPGIPDEPNQKTDQRYFAPVRTMAIWSFTKLDDPRWLFTSRYIILKGDSSATRPQKIGISNEQGWGAYAANGQLFVKKVKYQPKALYCDSGCNFEAFAISDIVELESLGPLEKVTPEAVVTHKEDWYLFNNVKFEDTDESIDANVLPKVRSIL